MKCAIIGGSVLPADYEEHPMEGVNALCHWFQEHHVTVLTGACGGFPLEIGRKCIAAGCQVVGYSPARNRQEHVDVYHHPLDGCTDIEYLERDYGESMNYLYASLPLVRNADVVIAIEGNWGTLFEMVASVVGGKKIFVLQSSGGISASFDQLYEPLHRACNYQYGEEVTMVANWEELISTLNQTL